MKFFMTSKTLWFNVLTTALAVIAALSNQEWVTPQIASIMMAIQSAVNIALRFITTQPVTFKVGG